MTFHKDFLSFNCCSLINFKSYRVTKISPTNLQKFIMRA